ncbi:UDP-N-acetylmuramoyl-tripeptide--D-alanyl-D-alanine ligase [Fredinandcohnia sp. QZ13]|uniref:UDP-N-acetylmuramoyl-tripeptide--D-alanyl-D- alanine ligase n=1 Tax=Fredinandcohnia sp. QZ13 TaxID=3073144 RepID=UPI0028537077|nr:UDP-N-acetylmuramoyl-tripeptide--D-alanyl-D-alanine ligase [Fredinandcohnia sp. QZ13]MDR4888267.1 UDP-N-acetylmuramoyl-tripeptide--D-alanyl-D-alanine ligase [Fredinandcohnia sp. QZ13]
MIKKTLAQIEQMANGEKLDPQHKTVVIEGVSIDTRTISSGNLYIPIIGETFNGHQFVNAAIENGAAAVLWGSDQPDPPQQVPVIFVKDTLEALQTLAKSYRDELAMKVVGITGSNGKTTTKDMVTAVLSTSMRVQKTEGNLNNQIGLPLTILRLKEDTEVAVLEMGMSAFGEIEFLTRLARPDVAVITNIGESHMMELGSREGIAKAKLEIVDGLSKEGLLIYHGDEPLLTEKVKEMDIQTTTFGESQQNDLYPLTIKQENEGTYFSINKQEKKEFYVPVLGKHNVNNAMAAIAVARHFDLSWDKIESGLKQIKITNMRLELIEGINGTKLINDAYNASPLSMKAAISLVHDLQTAGKKIVVLGDMLELGDKENEYHEEVGRFIQPDKVNYVFTYGRLGAHIASGAREQFPQDRVFAYQDKEQLIEALRKYLSEGDILLVKGSRGMKLEEIVIAFKK